MPTRLLTASMLAALMIGLLPAHAQFTGPDARGQEMTVGAAQEVRPGTYATLTGNIVSHLREDHYVFQDETGEIRIEVSESIWGGREVGPEDRVRLLGEVDRGLTGRYVWVKSLDLVE